MILNNYTVDKRGLSGGLVRPQGRERRRTHTTRSAWLPNSKDALFSRYRKKEIVHKHQVSHSKKLHNFSLPCLVNKGNSKEYYNKSRIIKNRHTAGSFPRLVLKRNIIMPTSQLKSRSTPRRALSNARNETDKNTTAKKGTEAQPVPRFPRLVLKRNTRNETNKNTTAE